MPDFAQDISFLNQLDPTGRHHDLMQKLINALNNLGRQTNAAPVGKTAPPSPISGLTVVGAGSLHRVSIQDNSPVSRGIHYHVEWDTHPQFTSPKQITLGPDRGRELSLGVNGPVYFRAYSSYPTSEPSEPVYHGTAGAPEGVNAGSLSLTVSGVTAGGATVTATGPIVGPAPLPSTGTGTEPSLLPQPSAGFGFDGRRDAPLELPA